MSTVVTGNLPPSTSINSTTNYFNNFFKTGVNTSANVNDAVVSFFQQITGDKRTGEVLAASVMYTALNQGLDPLLFIDELKRLKRGQKTEVRTPIDPALINTDYATYQELINEKDLYQEGQIFYLPSLNVFYRLKVTNSIVSVEADTSYAADPVTLANGVTTYNFFIKSFITENNELNAYLTVLLNLNRVNTSLLGINNSPQTSKYIKRAILL